MQNNATPLYFLRTKIKDIKVALFKSEISSEISLPNNIIETISTDDEGHVYFFTSCKGNYAAQIDIPFYAYLDYHKKGTDVRLRVSGKVLIVKEESANPLLEIAPQERSSHSPVLVKMKIMQAEYFGQDLPYTSITQKLRSTISHLFFPCSEEHHFNFG